MSRVGIVGAGPGGISLARLLQEQGHDDIVIFERSERIGGKSYSYCHEGLVHELGTCYVVDNYVKIMRWMKEFNIDLFNLRKSVLVKPDGSVIDFREYVKDDSAWTTLCQTLAYCCYWTAHRVRERTGWQRDYFNQYAGTSFEDWLLERNLTVIFRFALRVVAVMGYGTLPSVPALTGLAWTTPGLIAGSAMHNAYEPVQGWAALWARMAAKMDVRLSTKVISARRNSGGFQIETDKGVEQVDHLAISTPLDECSWIELPPEALAVADTIEWQDYVSSLIVAEGWFRDSDTRFYAAPALAIAGSGLGHVIGARRTGDKVEGLPANRPDVYVTYQYADAAISDEEMLEIMKRDIAAEGGNVTAVVTQRRWKYCPTLKRGAIRDGMVWKRNELQGHNNLWFTGASFSHEAVVNIVDFNKRLARRMVRAIRGGAPRKMEP